MLAKRRTLQLDWCVRHRVKYGEIMIYVLCSSFHQNRKLADFWSLLFFNTWPIKFSIPGIVVAVPSSMPHLPISWERPTTSVPPHWQPRKRNVVKMESSFSPSFLFTDLKLSHIRRPWKNVITYSILLDLIIGEIMRLVKFGAQS